MGDEADRMVDREINRFSGLAKGKSKKQKPDPNKDPNRGKYQYMYAEEFAIATTMLSIYEGELKWCDANFECFKFLSGKISLIFYPHKVTGTGNIHLRVRNQGGEPCIVAKAMLYTLSKGFDNDGYYFDFPVKHGRKVLNEFYQHSNDEMHRLNKQSKQKENK